VVVGLEIGHPRNVARRKIVRVARVAAGCALLPVGVALLVLPGPGIPLVVGGLLLLEEEFPWAGSARAKLGTWARQGVDWLGRSR
jgi:Putative transmembrane protein (PGPGW)